MHKVIQWTTGVVGTHAARAVHEHPEMELVGCFAWSESKSGMDVGELIGIGPIGVKATSSKEEILATEADCVLYMQQGELNPYGALEDICALLESGKNVISTAVTALIYPASMGKEVVDMLESSCRKGGTSFHETGIEPGWGAEVLPLTMSPIFKKVDSILVQELLNYSEYNQAETMFDIMGFGKPPEEEVVMDDAEMMTSSLKASIMMVAAGCNSKVEDFVYRRDVAVTDEAFDILAGHIPAGTVAAMRFSLSGVIDGREAITIEHITRVREDIAPDWPRGRGWKVTIKGDPSMVLETSIGTGEENEVEQSCIATAMHAVNSIYQVCNAEPGIQTFLELPIIVGRRILGGEPNCDYRGSSVTAGSKESGLFLSILNLPSKLVGKIFGRESVANEATSQYQSMDFDAIVRTISERTASIKPFGKVIRFKLDDNIFLVDGTATPPVVLMDDRPEVNATISVSVENFSRIINKEIKPMSAFVKGMVRMDGEMGAATALQKLF